MPRMVSLPKRFAELIPELAKFGLVGLAGSVTTLTALDFLGFGLPPGSPSLGELLAAVEDTLGAFDALIRRNGVEAEPTNAYTVAGEDLPGQREPLADRGGDRICFVGDGAMSPYEITMPGGSVVAGDSSEPAGRRTARAGAGGGRGGEAAPDRRRRNDRRNRDSPDWLRGRRSESPIRPDGPSASGRCGR